MKVTLQQIKNEERTGKNGIFIITSILVDGVWYNGFGGSNTLKMKEGDEIEVEEFFEEEYNGQMQQRVRFPFVFLKLEDVLTKGYHTIKIEPHLKEGVHLVKTAKNGNAFRIYKTRIKADTIFVTAWGDDYKYFDKGYIQVNIKQKAIKVLDEFQDVYLDKIGAKKVVAQGSAVPSDYIPVMISFTNEIKDEDLPKDAVMPKPMKPTPIEQVDKTNPEEEDDLPF